MPAVESPAMAHVAVGALLPPIGLLDALEQRGDRSDSTTTVTDLPPAVLATLLAHLTDPGDVLRAMCSNHYLYSAAETAPLHLVIRPPGASVTPVVQSLVQANAAVRATLKGVRCLMRGVQELDLAGCPVTDEDVAGVLADLRSLRGLVLDGCQKLTSAVADTLAVLVEAGPRAVSLQRCFRLGPAAACNLLAAAGARGSRLRCVLLSHLDRLELPRGPEGMSLGPEVGATGGRGGGVSGAGLRILALHNCSSLGSDELEAVAIACPSLELLLLGGSSDGLCRCPCSSSDPSPDTDVHPAALPLARLVSLLPLLRVLELTFFAPAAIAALKAELKRQGRGAVSVWDFCNGASVAAAAEMVQALQGATLPKDLAAACRGVGGRSRLVVDGGGCVAAGDVVVALRAAANCSDGRRRTPLHVTAARGDAAAVARLLYLGAATGARSTARRTAAALPLPTPQAPRDTGGATALFVAAENGHADAVRVLCEGGLDVLAANRAGESPLYIAALRGHCGAVEAMLRYCSRRGVKWQEAEAYGDGWTPLMAAAVADRQDTARVLLQAAGAQAHARSTSSEDRSDALNPCRRPPTCLPRPSLTSLRAVPSREVVLQALDHESSKSSPDKSSPSRSSPKKSSRGKPAGPLQSQPGSFQPASSQTCQHPLGMGFRSQEQAALTGDKGQGPRGCGMGGERCDACNRARPKRQGEPGGKHSNYAVGLPGTLGWWKEKQEGVGASEEDGEEVEGLEEGGGGGGGGSGVSIPLLDAQNRYGQTALHIAARRASVWFVVNLLSAGASPHIPDAYGVRPIDVAQKQGHWMVMEILQAWDGEQRRLSRQPLQRAGKQHFALSGAPGEGASRECEKGKQLALDPKLVGGPTGCSPRGLLPSLPSRKKGQRGETHLVWAPKLHRAVAAEGDGSPTADPCGGCSSQDAKACGGMEFGSSRHFSGGRVGKAGIVRG